MNYFNLMADHGCLKLEINVVFLFLFLTRGKQSYEDDENFGSYSVVGSFPKDFG